MSVIASYPRTRKPPPRSGAGGRRRFQGASRAERRLIEAAQRRLEQTFKTGIEHLCGMKKLQLPIVRPNDVKLLADLLQFSQPFVEFADRTLSRCTNQALCIVDANEQRRDLAHLVAARGRNREGRPGAHARDAERPSVSDATFSASPDVDGSRRSMATSATPSAAGVPLREFVSLNAAAQTLGISRQALHGRLQRGTSPLLPAGKDGDRLLFDRGAVERAAELLRKS